MTTPELPLLLHTAFGVAGLVAGPVAMSARKSAGLHAWAGESYHWLFVGLVLTAAWLSFLNWERSWFLLPIAVVSYAFALLGYCAAKIRWSNWLPFHIAGQGGSYIAMTTAVLVINYGRESWWAWALPTIVGIPIVTFVVREVVLGRRPGFARILKGSA